MLWVLWLHGRTGSPPGQKIPPLASSIARIHGRAWSVPAGLLAVLNQVKYLPGSWKKQQKKHIADVGFVLKPTASLLAASRRPFMFLLCELAAIKGQFHIDSLTYSLLSCRSAHCSASQGWSLSDGGLSCQVRAKARMWRRQSEVYVQIKPSISSSALPVYQTLQSRQERKTAREHFITEERSVVRAKIIDPRNDG